MFSEYASKFLAQSQSRLSAFGQGNDDTGSVSGGETSTRRGSGAQPLARSTRPYGRSFLGRGFGSGSPSAAGPSGNPYLTSASRFNFSARYTGTAQDAPLFHEADEEDGAENDDEQERGREAADLYALQRSRRVFASRLEDSAETDNDRSRASLGQSQSQSQSQSGRLSGHLSGSGRPLSKSALVDTDDDAADDDHAFLSTDAKRTSPGLGHSWSKKPSTGFFGQRPLDESRGRMVDIGLESTVADSEPPYDLTTEAIRDDGERDGHDGHDGHDDEHPFAPKNAGSFGFGRRSMHGSEAGLLRDGDSEAHYAASEPGTGPANSSVLQHNASEGASDAELFRHDPFFAWLYLTATASLFATFVLVWLHTSVPGSGGAKQPWGDTIYTTLLSSLHLLAVDTVVAVAVSLVWLAALRSFARSLVAVIVVAVPVILVSFSIYPLVASFQGGGSGSSGLQDTVMRWAALVPAVSAAVWVWMVWKGRSALQSAVHILEFASRILAANSALVLVGMGCLVLVVVWTWVWLAMFTRVFLGGSYSSQLSRFIISASSWWLGVFFVLMYLWTLSIIAGVQRATTAAAVSQWYFHRNVQPAPSSNEVVSAALSHAATTIGGSICLSTLLALAVRLPLLVLPRRLASGLGLFFYSFVPTPITSLTNPLTLTYAAIHSQNLLASSQGLGQLDFLSPEAPTTTLTPRAFAAPRTRSGHGRRGRYGAVGAAGAAAPLLPYRLAKLLLHSTRFLMATALGFAGWVVTARQLRIALPDGSIRGSAYAYVVGLVASFIGWGVLGAMEGILSGIVDAVIICYGSETRMAKNAGVGAGAGGYCMEAAELFGGRVGGVGDDDFRRTNREAY